MFRLVLVISFSFFTSLTATATEPPTQKPGDVLSFQITQAGNRRPPFLRVFPGGVTKDGLDASSVVGLLRLRRGGSKLYPKEDGEPGLIVVFRSLAFTPAEDGKYTAVFEGEFNAVGFEVSAEQMNALFAGDSVDLKIQSKCSNKVFAKEYTVDQTTELKVRLDGPNLIVLRAGGDLTVHRSSRYNKGVETFASEPVVHEVKAPDEVLYTGIPGKLAGLPIIENDKK